VEWPSELDQSPWALTKHPMEVFSMANLTQRDLRILLIYVPILDVRKGAHKCHAR
jgi:hypothetical protein